MEKDVCWWESEVDVELWMEMSKEEKNTNADEGLK